MLKLANGWKVEFNWVILGLALGFCGHLSAQSIVGTWDRPGDNIDAGNVVLVDHYALVTDGPNGVHVIDVADPTQPTRVGGLSSSNAQYLAVSGNLGYVADGAAGLAIFDLTVITNPVPAGSLLLPGTANQVMVAGNLAYVADGKGGGLRIVDVTDRNHPLEVGAYVTPGDALSVVVSNNYAYVADGTEGVQVIDVHTSAHPVKVANYTIDGSPAGLALVDNLLLVADPFFGMLAYDISNPTQTKLFSSYQTLTGVRNLVVRDRYAFVADAYVGLSIIDFQNPAQPNWAGGVTSRDPKGLALGGGYVYVADPARLLVVDLGGKYQDSAASSGSAPTLTGATLISADTLSFELTGTGDGEQQIEKSLDLVNWVAADRVTSTNGVAIFREHLEPSGPPTFYRAVGTVSVKPPLGLIPQIDWSMSVADSIGTNGGTLSLTNARGVIFTLTVPAGAVEGSRVMQMSAVTNLIGNPVGNDNQWMVKLEPSGLQFLRPAVLSIDLPADQPVGELVSYWFDGRGRDFGLMPNSVKPRHIETPIYHFSGGGAGRSPAGTAIPQTVRDAFQGLNDQIARLQWEARSAGAMPWDQFELPEALQASPTQAIEDFLKKAIVFPSSFLCPTLPADLYVLAQIGGLASQHGISLKDNPVWLTELGFYCAKIQTCLADAVVRCNKGDTQAYFDYQKLNAARLQLLSIAGFPIDCAGGSDDLTACRPIWLGTASYKRFEYWSETDSESNPPIEQKAVGSMIATLEGKITDLTVDTIPTITLPGVPPDPNAGQTWIGGEIDWDIQMNYTAFSDSREHACEGYPDACPGCGTENLGIYEAALSSTVAGSFLITTYGTNLLSMSFSDYITAIGQSSTRQKGFDCSGGIESDTGLKGGEFQTGFQPLGKHTSIQIPDVVSESLTSNITDKSIDIVWVVTQAPTTGRHVVHTWIVHFLHH
jgi:hypothetical protein